MREPHLFPFDPEFDSPPPPRAQLPDSSPSDQKRLLVNPFLALVDWLVALALLRAAIARVNFALFLIGSLFLLLGSLLLQYHCLDCGATGWLIRHGSHACPDEVFRRPSRRPRRLRVPRIATQIVVWCYLVAAAVILLLILTRA
jgi:hypothetical protein